MRYALGRWWWRLVVVVIGIFWTNSSVAQPRYIFWTDSAIYRGRADGSSYQVLLRARDPTAFAVADTLLYWANGSGAIIRGRPSGPDSDTLVTGAETIVDLALYREGGWLYWTEEPYGGITGRIRRTNLEGADVEELVTDLVLPRDLVIDTTNRKLYWIEWGKQLGKGSIRRANLDGSAAEVLFSGLARPKAITLDLRESKMYWINGQTIKRANLDGSNVEEVRETDTYVTGLALDVVHQNIYWATLDTLWRAGLDGSSVEIMFAPPRNVYSNLGVNRISSLVLGDNGAVIYWRDGNPERTAGNILRLHLQEGTVDTVLVGFGGAEGIAVDPEAGRIYWTAGQGKVLRANFDGTEVEELAEVPCGMGYLTDIVVDRVRDKLYWGHITDCPSYDIYRANLDGSVVEIVKDYNQPTALALDAQKGKIYWSQDQRRALMRADLDTLFETKFDERITDDVSIPWGLAVNTETSRIYWTDNARGTIERSDLNGKNRSVLISGLDEPMDLALDVSGGKIYWIEAGSDAIRRANLDGSEVEDLFTGLPGSQYLALAFTSSRILDAEEPTDLPEMFRLYQNYPNPFNPQTTIRFALRVPTHVSLVVYNLIGRRVARLVDRPVNAGYHEVVFDGSRLPSGVYFYRLVAGDVIKTKSMILMK